MYLRKFAMINMIWLLTPYSLNRLSSIAQVINVCFPAEVGCLCGHLSIYTRTPQ